MSATATHHTSRRIAVFGSVAAERPPEFEGEGPLSPAARAVLERVLEAVASSAESIAKPILDRAVTDGTITRAERHEMLLELSDPALSGGESQAPPPASLGARRALVEALAAIRHAAPAIAQPILDEAVGDERLTPAQERRILERLRSSPARALRGTLRARIASRAVSSA
jgi:chorismate mutase